MLTCAASKRRLFIFKIELICLFIENHNFDQRANNASFKNTKKPIANAHVKLIDENGQIIAEQFVGIDAVYRFDENIKCSVKYSIEASKLPGYVQNKVEVQLPDSSGEVKKDLILDWASDCIPDDLICLLNINPILFDLDK